MQEKVIFDRKSKLRRTRKPINTMNNVLKEVEGEKEKNIQNQKR